ncbi:protein far-red elongated hypocotyl 3 [Plakobranchus ocellatus]|uniref:Protein far-red elongated hypocotyl 3 n=1 Tax=Plakobranchus ocellatus TaxID=259542 RepID=A0AAV3ZE60_9GAST|nr:protein far-red elongated hypocotyl 3 [Plakobranchus ocellatus]
MQQQRSRECSPPRMLEEPQKYKKERQWFSSQYLRPRGFPIHPNEESLITSYTETIWQKPTRDMVMEYGSSIDEMSALCGEGPDGWLLSSHVDWLLRQANKQQHDSGSSKIGHKRTAFMTVRTMSDCGMLEVEYCLEHSEHSFDLVHLTLLDDLRKRIAGKLSQGIEPGRIRNDIRDNRDSLITRKHINNIKQQYNISLTQKHKLDGTSVDIWVQDLKKRLDNPVIFYKAQNSQHPYLKDEDFSLCLQTDFQRGMTIKYGHKIIFTDSTHNTTHYDFYLTSILVLDDFEEGVPVAWSISNREDSEILELFMQALKESCGQDIIADYFMSDLANNAFNAWCSVFSKPIKRLYCSWHVDKSWQKNILELVKIKEYQYDQTGEEETKWFECMSCGCVTHISCNLQINDGCEADCMKCVMCR